MTPEMIIAESMFQVVNKEGEVLDFKMNSAQRQIDETCTGRDIVPKARQEGVSTYFLAKWTARCLMKKNHNAVIISHESEATQRLLARCKFFLENIRGPRPEFEPSQNTIRFPKMNSQLWIGTAGSRKFGRGDTINSLHCSEYAYWANPAELLAGALQAVPMSGEIGIESTGNGVGNDYHQRCVRAYQGQSAYKCHFLNWQNFDEYQVDLTDLEEATLLQDIGAKDLRAKNLRDGQGRPIRDPEALMLEQGFTPGQILWRRIKLEELNYDEGKFQQEYPSSFDECFQASGNTIFTRVNYVQTDDWYEGDGGLWRLHGHPKAEYTYCVGADPAGGTGGNNSAAHVTCVDTYEQVAEFADNKTEPDVFAWKLGEIGRLFNEAFLVVEANNHGGITLKTLRDDVEYAPIRIYTMDNPGAEFEDRPLMQMGLRTTSRTRPIMVGNLAVEVATSYVIHSSLLKGEMSTFIEHENGKFAAADGCMDDTVLAAACALMGVERALLYASPAKAPRRMGIPESHPFLIDNIIREMHRNGRADFPIAPQHASAYGLGGLKRESAITLRGVFTK